MLSDYLSGFPPAVTHEHLKERGLFGLPPPPPGSNSAEYYHLMSSHRNPYGDLLMQTGAAAAAAAHLPDYISPVDGEYGCPLCQKENWGTRLSLVSFHRGGAYTQQRYSAYTLRKKISLACLHRGSLFSTLWNPLS